MTIYNLQQSPNTIGYPSPEFDKGAFDAAIVQKGYKIYQERAVACPCGEPGHPKPNCPYCGGLGYFFIEPTETIALITGVNVNTKYKEWTMDNAGTIAVTTFEEGLNFGFFDKITFKEKFGRFSETRKIRFGGGKHFVWLTFKLKELYSIYMLNVAGTMIELSSDMYTVENDGYTIVINAELGEIDGLVLSVYYKHYIQYNVIDLPHELRASNITDANGNLQKIDLPVQAIARRANFVMGESNQEIWRP